MRSNDIPATNAELDSFYGVPPTQAEINEAIGRHTRAFDKDDLAEIMYKHGDEVLAIILDKRADGSIICSIIEDARRNIIADRASYSLYGKAGHISPLQVE